MIRSRSQAAARRDYTRINAHAASLNTCEISLSLIGSAKARTPRLRITQAPGGRNGLGSVMIGTGGKAPPATLSFCLRTQGQLSSSSWFYGTRRIDIGLWYFGRTTVISVCTKIADLSKYQARARPFLLKPCASFDFPARK